MKKKTETQMVTDVSQIPESFDSEDEERDWWATHEFSDEAIAQMQEGVAEANEWLKRFQTEYRRKHAWARRRVV